MCNILHILNNKMCNSVASVANASRLASTTLLEPITTKNKWKCQEALPFEKEIYKRLEL